MGRKKKQLEFREGVGGKTCGNCREWKPVNEFNKEAGGACGLQSKCRTCQSVLFREYYKDNDELLLKKREYHYNNREARALYNRRYYRENQEKVIKYREENRERYTEHTRNWRLKNKERSLLPARRRRAKINLLLNDLTIAQQESVFKRFKGCALTGSEVFDLDHVIPIITGHGGTTYGNMIPLRHDLNQSKGTKNIFEWFEANRQRFNLSQTKFDETLAWLADINGVTVSDYKSHVYWCHENPHHIDDLREDSGGEAI